MYNAPSGFLDAGEIDMTRVYVPVAMLSPERLERRRETESRKRRRLRAADPEAAKETARRGYWRDPAGHQAKTKAWRAANPDKVRQSKQRYRSEKRAAYIVQMVRAEAKKKGVKFDISQEWVQSRLDMAVCELSGLPFNLTDPENRKDAPSIDRIEPDGDYTEGNCRLILFGLNSLLRRRGNAGIRHAVARIHELRTGQ